MKKNKPKKTIVPIQNPAASGKKKRLPKHNQKGGYFIKAVSKFHN